MPNKEEVILAAKKLSILDSDASELSKDKMTSLLYEELRRWYAIIASAFINLSMLYCIWKHMKLLSLNLVVKQQVMDMITISKKYHPTQMEISSIFT